MTTVHSASPHAYTPGSTSPTVFVDEAHPELSALLGSAWWAPEVHCQAPGCTRPAMLAVDLNVRISPFESDDQIVLCCDLASCYESWWSLADATVCDVEPLTRHVAQQATGLELGSAA